MGKSMDQLEEQGVKATAFPTLSAGISSGQRAQLELLYKKAPVGLCILDRNLCYISINEALASINGRSVEEHIGCSLYDVIPEITPIFEPLFREIIETGKPALGLGIRCPAPANPQEERFWLVNIYPFVDEQENLEAVAVIVQDITDLKRTEIDLLNNRQLLQTLIESTKAVPWVANAKTGQFTYIGPQVVKLLGYPIESWFEENFWLDHIHPDDRESAVDLRLKSYCLGLKDYECEYRMIALNGSIIWIRDIVNIEWQAGEPRTLRGFMINISFHKHVEKTIKDSEERYRAIVNDQTELICRFLPDGTLTFVNDAYCRYFSKKRDELVGSTFWTLIPEEYHEKCKNYLASLNKENPISSIEHAVLMPDGSTRWQEWTDRAIYDDEGNLIEFQSVGRDITDQKRLEGSLRESQLRYSLAAKAGSVGIWDWNLETNEIYIDSVLKSILGFEDHEIENSIDVWTSRAHPQDIDRVISEAQAHIEGRTTNYECEHRMLHKDGGIRWFLTRGMVVTHGENGRALRMIGTDVDITEQKQMENKLKSALFQLSKKNRYKTIIYSVAQSVHQSIDPQEVLRNAVEALAKNIDGADNVGIYLVEGEEAVLRAHFGVTDQFVKRAGRIPYPQGVTWKTLISGEPRYVADVEKDGILGPAGREMGIKSYQCVPIKFKDKTIGTLNIASFEKNAFDEEELNLLEIVAEQIETALGNAIQAETIKEAQQSYESLVNSVDGIVWELETIDLEAPCFRFSFVSKQAERLLGYPVECWLKDSNFWRDHVHPDDRDWAIYFCMKSTKDKQNHELEYRMIAADGSTVWLRDIVTVTILDDRHVRLRGVMVDITEQNRAQDVLRDSEERYRTLYESNPLMCFTTNSEGKVLYINQSGAEQLGYTTEEIVGKSVLNVFYEDDKKTVLDQLTVCLQNPTHVAHWELRMVHKDGRILWVREFARSIHEINGNKAILIVCEDITERKGAEQALQKALSEIGQLKDQLQAENIYLKEEIRSEQDYGEIVGNSQAIKGVLRRAEKVAKTDSTILVTGETGTGKELLARMIHNLSHRNGQAMVKVNCAAIPSALIESELFGREKGAYTGALTKQIGRFELANGSTIFLDEIGELSMELQAKLLRVLQDGEFERLGSPQTITVDVRVIAATNKNLAKAVSEGRFREDLYYRLNVFPIHVPPLRERMDDIPNLVWKFVKEFSDKMGKRIESIPKKTMDALLGYHWPGNVRELRNVIERAMILTQDNTLRVELPKTEPLKSIKTMTMKETERSYILQVLQMTGWRVRGKGGAAEVLGLKPSTLESRMSKLGIVRNK
jgi:PAS domain S-box-containing protein